VSDTHGANERLLQEGLLEISELARRSDDADGSTMMHREACGVVAAVLQATEPVEKDRRALVVTDVANDATHVNLG
jgi:hypothetical protein